MVVGSANMDLVLRVDSLPAAGETVLGGGPEWLPGGKGANQAVAAALSGADVRMIGCVGDDAGGRAVLAALQSAGVDTTSVRVLSGQNTGMAVVLVAPDGENAIAVSPGANLALAPADAGVVASSLGPSDVLLVQMEVRADVVAEAVSLAAAAGSRRVLNLAPAAAIPAATLAQLDLLVVNRSEAEFLLNRPLANPAARREAVRDLRALGPAAVVLTAGGEGCVLGDAGGLRDVPALPVQVVDTSGAGDAFVGALCAALAGGAGIDAAVVSATRTAAGAVQVPGAQLVASPPDEATPSRWSR